MFKLLGFFFKSLIVLAALYLMAQAALGYALEACIGATVRIGGIRLNLLPAEIRLERVRIFNLKNFKEPMLAILPEIFIRFEPLEFLKGRVHIRSLRMNMQEITIERNSAGEINLNEMRRILNQKQSAQQGSAGNNFLQPAGAPQHGPQKLMIDWAEFSLGHLVYADSAAAPPFRKEYPLNVDRQVLTNLTDPVSVAQQVITTVFKYAGLKISGPQFDPFIDKAKKTLAGLFQ